MRSERRAALRVTAGSSPSRLIESAVIAVLSAEATDSTVQRSQAGRDLLAICRRSSASVDAIAPPGNLATSWSAARKTEWKSVELSSRAERLRRVWLPAAIVDASKLIGLGTLPTQLSAREVIVLGTWAKFAHPRQRTGARVSDERSGLTAEIALAVKPDLLILVGEWRSLPFLIASNDQIAAELAGISFAQLKSKAPPETGGPWEQPLVQRATELGIGVNRPGLIDATISFDGADDAPTRAPFEAFASDLLARMGVAAHG